nr:hypothetical protein [Tanacetum cinerariifolium]
MCEMFCQIIQRKQEEKRIEEDQAANAQYWKIPACCDDDDDYNSTITPNEPIDSLIMGDEHLNTILATESSEFLKSCVENLVPNPKSMLNRDYSIISFSSKIDSLLDEFTGELTLLRSIPPRIDETDCHLENEIRLIERLLYDNSSLRPPKEFGSKNSNAEIESFSPPPIPIEDSDSRIEEIDLTFTPDDPMPLSIEDDYYDSERDVLILEGLLDNYSFSLPVIESYHFDIPSFSRPPTKPPDVPTPSPLLHVPSPPLLLPSADRRSDIPETDMPFWKMLCLTTLTSRFELRESSIAVAAGRTGPTLACRIDYGFIDTMDASI